jgi:hypothetical protein
VTIMPARVRFQLLSRRDLLARASAVAGLTAIGACDGKAGDSAGTDPTDGIEPITPNDDFYVTSCCGTPVVDRDAWSLTFKAAGTVLATADLVDLEGMGPRDREHTLECIGAGPTHQAISNTIWTGLPLTEVLAALGIEVPASAVEMKFTSADEYTTSLPIGDLDKPVWLVWRMNGEPLPEKHGTTARLLVPGRYGMKNPKWIVELEFVDEPYLGFWETRGWSNSAEYAANTFVRDPVDNLSVSAGTVEMVGTAYAGSDEIETVEVTTDGGETWAAAELTYQNGPDVWTLWRFSWDASPGVYRIQARCTTKSGAQSGDEYGTGTLDGYDGSMVVDVEVTS